MKCGHRMVVVACLVLGTVAGAGAGVTKTVVDLPSTQGTMRFLYVRPDAPIAAVVGLAGLEGYMAMQSNGEAQSATALCDPMYRNIDSFAARGIAVAVVAERYPNMLPIVDWLRARDAIPHWIAGMSRGSEAAVALAVQAQAAAPVGALFFSPAIAYGAAITGPAMVIIHAEDTVSGNIGESVYNSLTSASARELVILTGGGEVLRPARITTSANSIPRSWTSSRTSSTSTTRRSRLRPRRRHHRCRRRAT